MTAASVRPSTARRAGLLVCWLLVALAAVAVQRWVLPRLREDPAGLGAARWLWAATDRFELRPVAFLLFRDFDLPTPPRTARLLALGDEEYSLFLNGAWVGSSRYLPEADLDQWDVSALLRPGRNRLVAELRSGQGPGGFVARLLGDDGEFLLASDPSWRVLRGAVIGLESGRALPAGEPPVDLGPSPLGRWGTPAVGELRPALGSREYAEARAARFRLLGHGEWRPLDAAPGPSRPLGRAVTFDWGETVAGYLAIELVSGGGEPGLVVFGEAPPLLEEPPADALVIRVPGRNYWLDALPRRFRYATVVVGDDLVDAKVYLDEGARTPSELRALASRGVLGIAPPALRAPVEDEIWRELEGFAGRARGKGR